MIDKRYVTVMLCTIGGIFAHQCACGAAETPSAPAMTVVELAASSTAVPPLPVIRGSEEFDVELPRPTNDITINPIDFGADPNAADNTEAFRKAIAAAREQKAARIVLPFGEYRFTSSEWLEFDGFADFEFDGQGSTLCFWKQRGVPSCIFNIMNSQRVRFANFKIDWDWERDPIASVAIVEKIGPNREFVDLRFVDYDNFPNRDITIKLIDQMSPDRTGGMGEGSVWFNFNGEKKWLSGNLLRGHLGNFTGGLPAGVKEGQLYKISHYYYDFTAVAMSGNVNLTLENIDLYSSPGFGFHAYGKQHHWQMRNVNIVRKPGTRRPASVASDHVHITKSQGYFKMEHCEISMGNDDCFNANDQSRVGYRKSARVLLVKHLQGDFFVGDEVEFRKSDFAPYGEKAEIAKLDFAEDGLNMEFDRDLPGRNGELLLLFNRTQKAKNIIIRNCYFHDNRAHAMRLQGDNITVENSVFKNHAMGMAITTGYTIGSWCEGYGAQNILIRNNTFANLNTGNHHALQAAPMLYIGVFLKSDPSEEKTAVPMLRNILLENNRFINFPGVLSYISSADNVVFKNNIIHNDLPSFLHPDRRGDITVDYSTNVFILGNQWQASASGDTPKLRIENSPISQIYYSGNKLIGPQNEADKKN